MVVRAFSQCHGHFPASINQYVVFVKGNDRIKDRPLTFGSFFVVSTAQLPAFNRRNENMALTNAFRNASNLSQGQGGGRANFLVEPESDRWDESRGGGRYVGEKRSFQGTGVLEQQPVQRCVQPQKNERNEDAATLIHTVQIVRS